MCVWVLLGHTIYIQGYGERCSSAWVMGTQYKKCWGTREKMLGIVLRGVVGHTASAEVSWVQDLSME